MKMLKDKKIIALLIILVVFTISYFVIANKISYAFVNDYDPDFYYDKTLEVIKQSAIAYAKEKKDEFTDSENIKYVTVQELIDSSYLIPDSEGNIKNPLNEEETLNSKNIKIKLENDEFQAEVER